MEGPHGEIRAAWNGYPTQPNRYLLRASRALRRPRLHPSTEENGERSQGAGQARRTFRHAPASLTHMSPSAAVQRTLNRPPDGACGGDNRRSACQPEAAGNVGKTTGRGGGFLAPWSRTGRLHVPGLPSNDEASPAKALASPPISRTGNARGIYSVPHTRYLNPEKEKRVWGSE